MAAFARAAEPNEWDVVTPAGPCRRGRVEPEDGRRPCGTEWAGGCAVHGGNHPEAFEHVAGRAAQDVVWPLVVERDIGEVAGREKWDRPCDREWRCERATYGRSQAVVFEHGVVLAVPDGERPLEDESGSDEQ